MPYSSFTIEEVESKFNLNLQTGHFLPNIDPISPSLMLEQFLNITLPLARETGSEKARSELLVSPILVEVRTLMNNSISLFSGEDFTVDSLSETLCERELGLNGICGFLISRSPIQFKINAPVIALVEAKKGVLKDGWGQCIAEMVAAQRFNQLRQHSIEFIYGVVTSGTRWQFIEMKGSNITIDPEEYSLPPLEPLLGILKWMASRDS
jgi:hypothetical protein